MTQIVISFLAISATVSSIPVFHALIACWYVKITITGDANDEKRLVELINGDMNNFQVKHEDSCSK